MSEQAAWDQRYSAPGMLFGEEPNLFLRSCADLLVPGMKALALADGEARNGVWLAERGLDVLSVDISPVAQAKARTLAASRGVEVLFASSDLKSWNWQDSSFDVVVAIFIQFSGPPVRDEIFEGIKRTLKPGGLLILEGYRPEQIELATGGPPHVDHMYTEDLLREAFSGFEILTLESIDTEIFEGSAHRGPSALIDLAARKPT